MSDSTSDTKPQSDSIRFVLDGDIVELRDVDPTRTVLQFLREDLLRTGTKEGCAEGDCGACTVVIAEINRDGNDLSVRAINSCIQFLPTIDGKELITVESLGGAGDLHPVQKAMVDHHGSQCGFCTPGFVMSLFALYKTNAKPTRREIDDALAGNLCRCTGYRPIIAAAETMYEAQTEVDWLRQPGAKASAQKYKPPSERIAALQSLRRTESMLTERSNASERAEDVAAMLTPLVPSPMCTSRGTNRLSRAPGASVMA